MIHELLPYGCPTCGGVPTVDAIALLVAGHIFPVRVYTPRECCSTLLQDAFTLAELDLQMRQDEV